MKISVALCTYNGADFLAEQLDSIGKQTTPVDEIMVCDDGSSDHTLDILENYKADGLPIHIHRNPKNLGFVKNFEKAVQLCTGDIIFLADQDDIWLPHKVATMIYAFQNKPAVMLAFSDAQLIDTQGNSLANTLWECVGLTPDSQVSFLDLLNNARITGATVAFRQQLLDIALPILPDWIHDAWFGLTAAATGSVYPIPDKLILYRQHANNQIGIRKSTWRSFINKAGRLATTPHTEQAERYIPLLERLQRYPDATQHLLQKIRHLQARQPQDGKRLNILGGILRETLNRRYFHYAYGWNSILRDLSLLGWQTIHHTPPASAPK